MAPLEEKKKRSLSLLISTLLLVVMVVAGAALIYAYLIGFIGNTTHVPSSIQITGFCASSAANGCGTSVEYSVTVTNIGGNKITGTLALTFTDQTNSFGSFSGTPCSVGTLSPGTSVTCTGNFTTLPTTGDLITVIVVTSDGGTAAYATKTIS